MLSPPPLEPGGHIRPVKLQVQCVLMRRSALGSNPTLHLDGVGLAAKVQCVRAMNVYGQPGWYGVTRVGGTHLVLPPTPDERPGDVSAIVLAVQVQHRVGVEAHEPHTPVACVPASVVPKAHPKGDLPSIAVGDDP